MYNQDFDRNLLQHPSKRTLVIYVVGWIICSLLVGTSITDYFTVALFRSQNMAMLFLYAMATASVIKIVVNYRRNHQTPTSK